MIGNGYWATGITVRYGYSGESLYGWAASVDFYDAGTGPGAISTQGTLKTRYFVREGTGPDADPLSAAVNAVKRDAERLGISFPDYPPPTVYYEGDSGNDDYPPPDGWRGMVNAQAERLGWRPMYATEDQS